jgi:hypothetical protein
MWILMDEGSTTIDFPYDDKRTIGNLVKGGKPFHMRLEFQSFPQWFSGSIGGSMTGRIKPIGGINQVGSGDGLNIYHCLDAFRKEETLQEDNTWYCSKCKNHVKAKVKMEIYNAPDHLILQLKRFTMSTRKGFMGRTYGSRQKDT